jgi:hypothetical protein
MEYVITEKQLKLILSNEVENQEIGEQTEAEPVSSEPTAGTSSTQSGGQGYPSVGKWESGLTRGPANQIGITKWSDVVGSTLKRGKANPLKEQALTGIQLKGNTDYVQQSKDVAKLIKEYPHATNEIAGFAVAAVTIATGGADLVVAAGVMGAIGLYDAYKYSEEGDTKTAALTAFFSLIPFVSEIPGVKQLGSKLLVKIGEKISKNIKLSENEMRIVINIYKQLDVIKPKIDAIRRKALVKLGAGYASYQGADYAYDEFMGGSGQSVKLTQKNKTLVKQTEDFVKFIEDAKRKK